MDEDEINSPPGMQATCQTVLLVEDEPMLRELGTMMIESLGYAVFAAENGVDALRIVRQHPERRIDLLVTDIAMPEMGGPELVENLRPLSPRTKIIFCSGFAGETILPGNLNSVVHFLDKPYSIQTIARKIRDIFGRSP